MTQVRAGSAFFVAVDVEQLDTRSEHDVQFRVAVTESELGSEQPGEVPATGSYRRCQSDFGRQGRPVVQPHAHAGRQVADIEVWCGERLSQEIERIGAEYREPLVAD